MNLRPGLYCSFTTETYFWWTPQFEFCRFLVIKLDKLNSSSLPSGTIPFLLLFYGNSVCVDAALCVCL